MLFWVGKRLLPSPDFGNNNSDATGFDMNNQNPKLSHNQPKSYF
jgi:hypothetical protein